MPSPGAELASVQSALRQLKAEIDRLARRPSAGGGVLGRAGVYANFPSSMAKNTTITPTSMGMFGTAGDHGVSIAGTAMTIQPGLYIVSCPVGFAATSYPGTLELHSITAFDSPGVGRSNATSFNDNEAWAPGVRLWSLAAPLTVTPKVAFFTTSAAARTFALFGDEWDFEFIRLSE